MSSSTAASGDGKQSEDGYALQVSNIPVEGTSKQDLFVAFMHLGAIKFVEFQPGSGVARVVFAAKKDVELAAKSNINVRGVDLVVAREPDKTHAAAAVRGSVQKLLGLHHDKKRNDVRPGQQIPLTPGQHMKLPIPLTQFRPAAYRMRVASAEVHAARMAASGMNLVRPVLQPVQPVVADPSAVPNRFASNPESKPSTMCRYVVEGGSCKQGNDCWYAHSMLELKWCPYFQKGNCKYGAECKLAHIPNQEASRGSAGFGLPANVRPPILQPGLQSSGQTAESPAASYMCGLQMPGLPPTLQPGLQRSAMPPGQTAAAPHAPAAKSMPAGPSSVRGSLQQERAKTPLRPKTVRGSVVIAHAQSLIAAGSNEIGRRESAEVRPASQASNQSQSLPGRIRVTPPKGDKHAADHSSPQLRDPATHGEPVDDQEQPEGVLEFDELDSGGDDSQAEDDAQPEGFMDFMPEEDFIDSDMEHNDNVQPEEDDASAEMATDGTSSMKSTWSEFCKEHGDGVSDPAEHNAAFLRKFLDKVLRLDLPRDSKRRKV